MKRRDFLRLTGAAAAAVLILLSVPLFISLDSSSSIEGGVTKMVMQSGSLSMICLAPATSISRMTLRPLFLSLSTKALGVP